MDLNAIAVFTKVVQAESFTRASRELGMPKSTVSRKVSELEEELGARLLQRTTRKLSLTDVGRTFYEHALRVMSEAEEAALAVRQKESAPRGLLRVTTPLNFDYFASVVASFLARYADVRIDLVGTDRVVDLVQDGFDVAVRAGVLRDSTLVARNLGALRSFLVASPKFLAKNGAPKAPEDLARVDCVVFGTAADRAIFRLSRAGETKSVLVRPRLLVNDFDFLEEAALAGIGIAMLPEHRSVQAVGEKRLRRVLPEWCSPEIPLNVVYPSTRHLSPTVKAFVDHVRDRMTPLPWERKPAG
jgi:DNA-binding transcriptional LysR family regulator